MRRENGITMLILVFSIVILIIITGIVLYYKILGNAFELDDQFEQIRKKYEIIYKDLDIEKNNRNYSIMVMLLIVSLILNTFTIISYMFMW